MQHVVDINSLAWVQVTRAKKVTVFFRLFWMREKLVSDFRVVSVAKKSIAVAIPISHQRRAGSKRIGIVILLTRHFSKTSLI